MENKKKFFTDRSKILLFAGLIGVAYAIYLIAYFFGTMTEGNTSDQIGGFLATAI